MGIDNSDNDKLKISKSGEVGISNIFVSDGATIDFVVPPKLPSYTVSTLATASTAGAGACAFATDLAGATYTYGVAAGRAAARCFRTARPGGRAEQLGLMGVNTLTGDPLRVAPLPKL